MTDGQDPPSWFQKLYTQLSGPVSTIRERMLDIIYHQPSSPSDIQDAHTNLHQLEKKCLTLSGMELDKEIFSFDRIINNQSWVHEICCGLENNGKNLVLLHGYGGTSLSFVRMFKALGSRFRVFALDHLGMGMSSRREFLRDWSRQETIDYFVEAIEKWREVALGPQKMTLLGHSFGGYMAVCYAKKYPQHIQKLILVSPAGMQFGDLDSSERAWKLITKKSWWIKAAHKATTYHPTPSDLINIKIIGQRILDLGLGSRFGLSQEEKRAYMSYFRACCAMLPNSQSVIYKLFFFPQTRTEDPICDILRRTQFPFEIDLYFGTKDWMHNDNNIRILDQPNQNTLSMKFIELSGHQMTFDNPKRLCEEILKADLVRSSPREPKSSPTQQQQFQYYLQI